MGFEIGAVTPEEIALYGGEQLRAHDLVDRPGGRERVAQPALAGRLVF